MQLPDVNEDVVLNQTTTEDTTDEVFMLPVSFAQQRLWFLEQLDPGKPVYNIAQALRLKGILNVAVLEKSLNALIHRHEVLRTSFSMQDGQPVQVIVSHLNLTLTVESLSDLPPSQQAVEVRRRVAEEAQHAFNLSQPPLLRAKLLKLNEAEHIFLLTVHHIISDGWSMGILARDLSLFYEGFMTGWSPNLPELPIQYADYAIWQNELLQGEALAKQASYWKQQLAGAAPVLELPTDCPRPPMESFRGARCTFTISEQVTQAITELSRREGCTLFMTLLAAFQTLLYRYSGQDDVVVGTPIAGRTQAETEGLIGFFVNTLVMRTDLSGAPSFQQVLKRVKEVALGAYSHQDLPFEKLVEELQPERALSYNPVFQVMFILQNTPRQGYKIPGITVEQIPRDHQTEKFDLTLSLYERQHGLGASLSYNTDLFDAATMERMATHFQTLLEGIVQNPEQQLLELPLLTTTERQEMLARWNDTQTDYPNTVCLHQLVEDQAKQIPDQVAFIFPTPSGEQLQLTYQALNQKAEQLARYLQQRGAGPNTVIALYLERSWEMVVGLLGVLKAGGTYLPLDPAYPPDRLAFMLADSEAPILLTQEPLLSVLPDHSAQVLCLDRDWPDIEAESLARPDPVTLKGAVKPADLAYLIYTSGSTGKPKGVQIPHQAAVNFLTAMAQQPGLTQDDVLLAVTTLSFDIALLELFLPLLVGARTVIASREVAADGHQLQHYLLTYDITVMQATPVTWKLLIASGWTGKQDLKVLCGGEALSRQLATQLLERCASVWNMYGPTETTVWSTVSQVTEKTGLIDLGHPIANTQLYVLDTMLEPVPIGIPGELYIGGDGLAKGYLNRPELTAERFIPDPFSDHPTARMYKTGDLVRYRNKGEFEFIGRIDHQIKIRGFRIELGEIEATLRQPANVAEAVVILSEDTPGDQRLVAYLTSSQGVKPSQAELRAYLKEKLPDYMIPSAYLIMDQFPLTPNGKINRSALPVPAQIASETEADSAMPKDALELQLTKIWEQILKHRSIGTNDNFFELGGHSLLAVQLMSQIEELVGLRLPLATLFQAPTVAQMADILRDEGWQPSWSSLVPIQPGGSKPPFFFVHAHGGNVVGFYDLARHLEDDQPFYGLQAQGLDGKIDAFEQLELMAEHYIKEIQTIQPQGPYFIGGFCFGGKVAFEMAQQLQAKGETVAFLVMLQTHHSGYPKLRPGTTSFHRVLYRFAKRADLELSNFLEVEARRKLAYSAERIKHLWTRIQLRLQVLKPHQNGRSTQASTLKRLEMTHSRALRRYAEQPYQGPITLLRVEKQPLGIYPDLTLGWKDTVQDKLNIYEIPGHLVGMLDEPRVQIVAERLSACLKEAQARPSSESSCIERESKSGT